MTQSSRYMPALILFDSEDPELKIVFLEKVIDSSFPQ